MKLRIDDSMDSRLTDGKNYEVYWDAHEGAYIVDDDGSMYLIESLIYRHIYFTVHKG